jgi:hypothetical protein
MFIAVFAIASQMNLVQTLPRFFHKIRFNIILPPSEEWAVCGLLSLAYLFFQLSLPSVSSVLQNFVKAATYLALQLIRLKAKFL